MLDEQPDAIVIIFVPRVVKDEKGKELQQPGETVTITRSQVAMLSRRERQLEYQ